MLKIIWLKLLVNFIFLIVNSIHSVNAQYNTDSAKIYLLTISWGDDPSSAFGHSGIRVVDKRQNFDAVYGYGTYDFDTPNFYLKFTTGKLLYSLSVTSYERFFYSYQTYGQALYEQQLKLTNKEKWLLMSNLSENYKPENRYYRYDFFHDNCATRIRDIIEKSVDGKLMYDSSYVTKPITFRQLIRPNYITVPWLNYGIDLVFGTATDEVATVTGYMFLPEHLMNIYNNTNVVRDDTITPLSEKPRELFPSIIKFEKPSFWHSPLLIFTLIFLLVLGLTIVDFKRRRCSRWIDFPLFFVVSLLGSLILFLMTASLHEELWCNYNILWANPLAIIVAFGALVQSKSLWFKYILWLYLVSISIFILASFFIVQEIPIPTYLLIAIVAIRGLNLLQLMFFTNK